MSFFKNKSASSTSSSSSSSSSSVVDEMSEMSLKNTSLDSSDEDFSSCNIDRLLKHQMLLNKISDLQYRARERQDEFQTLLERFNYIHESLELEIEKVEKSMVSMEWLEDFQKTIDEFQANMTNNVSRLRENFKRIQQIAAQKSLPVKAKGKPGKEHLDAKVVKSIQSVPPCPTVAEMKANPTATSTYLSNLIGLLNTITKSTSISPATTRALKLSAVTVENLNKAFQDHCLEIKSFKTPPKESKAAKDVDRDIFVTPVHQSAVQQQKVQKSPALAKKPKVDDYNFPQVQEPPVRVAHFEERPSDKAPEVFQRPSADGAIPPAPARAFALPKIAQSVEETKATVEQKEKVTVFKEVMAQKDTSHHASPVRSYVLPEISQSVEEARVEMEPMERTETSFKEIMTPKVLQSPPPRGLVEMESMERTETSFKEIMTLKVLQSPPPHGLVEMEPMERTETSFKEIMTPKVLQSPPPRGLVEMESMERTETSFKEIMTPKVLQSPPPRGFHCPSPVRSLPVEEHQSPSPVHTRRTSSAVKLPKIQTQVKPASLEKSDKPETRKYDSPVSSNIEEQVKKDSEEDVDKLFNAKAIDSSYVIDVTAQENNLQQLDQAFQNNNISSEMYNLCRGTVGQTLQSVELRLACLLRRYVKHVQMKQLRTSLEENFKATRNLKDGLGFKKVHSQLCKFDRYRQRVKNIWDAKQASANETRRLCIARMAYLYQQVNAVHGLHLIGISCVQKHVSLPLLTVTPVRFSSDLCPFPPRQSRSAPSRASPARHLQIYPKALHGIKATRNLPGSSLTISRVQY